MAALVLATAATGVGVERWANRRAQAELSTLSARLGRPVTAGTIDVSWLAGFGVEVRDLTIGRDPAMPREPDPVLHVPRARVRVAALRTLASLGRRPIVKR